MNIYLILQHSNQCNTEQNKLFHYSQICIKEQHKICSSLSFFLNTDFKSIKQIYHINARGTKQYGETTYMMISELQTKPLLQKRRW